MIMTYGEDRMLGVRRTLSGELISKLAVQDGESDGTRKINVCLEKWNDFSPRFGCSHNQHVLCVTEDRVAEQDVKEHQAERKHLLYLLPWWQKSGPAASLPVVACHCII